ncbi:MAG: hypothetical protein ABIW76_23925 [Fibrobacteria bacterium]
MDPSEKIQPIRGGGSGAEKVAVPSVFAGTVVGVKQENGVQNLEVQYSQGKLRFEADGDFQLGEKVRLTFSGNGSVEVEKGAPPDRSAWDQAGYTLPRNMSTLKDLQAFETNVADWMASKQAPGSPAAKEAQALRNTSLPQLLMKAMGEDGGRSFLAGNLPELHRGVVSALMDALQESDGEMGSKASLLDLLKSLGKPASDHPAGGAGATGGTGAFLAGEGSSPWFGRIADKQKADGVMTPMQRLQFSGAGGPPRSDPNFRYLIDMGGRTMEVFSPQDLDAGSYTDFELERQGGRAMARFSEPAAGLAAGLRTAMAGASPDVRQGMALASRFLNDFEGEPYFGKLVEDFGAVLSQSGVLSAKSADGRPAVPDQKDLDGLLKLFVAYPRDTEHPERQAQAWGDALKDPQAMMRLLKTLRPDQDQSLLRSGTVLHLMAEGHLTGPGGEALGGVDSSEEGPQATSAWLKKLLPEAFRTEDLLKLAGNEPPLTAGKENDAAKFLLQAVANGFPREDQIQEGKPQQFYFYQGQEWRNLQVTWQRDGGKQGKSKAGPQAPLQVRVETKAKHMGQVQVGVSWEPKGARLDFRNQFHDVREEFVRALPELEKSLTLLDFKVTSWSYDLLPNDPGGPPDPGWTRPASLSDGVNLDLMG